MKIYGSSTLMWGKSFEHICKKYKELGLKGMELWAEQCWYQQFSEKEIIQFIHSYGLEVSLHAASWDLNLCSINKGIRKQSIKEIERSMQLAASIQAVDMTVHPGRMTLTGEWEDWHWNCLQEVVDILEALAKQYNIILSLELMEQERKELVTIPERMNQLTNNRSPFIQTTFDIAHTPIQIDPISYYRQLERINKIHLSDSSYHRYHLPLGEGEIHLSSILKELENATYPIVLEGYDSLGKNEWLKKHLMYLNKYMLKANREGVM